MPRPMLIESPASLRRKAFALMDQLFELLQKGMGVHVYQANCLQCGQRMQWTGTLLERPPCPHCGRPAG